jgi:hypothetical protein
VPIDPLLRHDPCHMADTGTPFTRQGGRNQRKWRVWYTGFRCPVCGAKAARPRNPFRGRVVPPPVCDGITYTESGKPVKRPARLGLAPHGASASSSGSGTGE